LMCRRRMLSCHRGFPLRFANAQSHGSRCRLRCQCALMASARLNRKRKPRAFCLRIADSAVDDTSPHQQREVLPIKVAPLQADDLAGPQTETGSYQNHRAVRLSKFSEDQADVMHAQHSRDRSAPATLPYQIKWGWRRLSPSAVYAGRQDAKGCAGLPLTSPQRQRSKPLLNLNRLDFVDKAPTPTRSYPATQAGEVRLLGSIAWQWQFFLDVVIRKSIECHRQAKSVLKI